MHNCINYTSPEKNAKVSYQQSAISINEKPLIDQRLFVFGYDIQRKALCLH